MPTSLQRSSKFERALDASGEILDAYLRIHQASRPGGIDRNRRAIENGAAGRRRAVHGRRYHADRSDEAERRDSRTRARYQSPAARQDRRHERWRPKDRRDRSQLRSGESRQGATRLRRAVAGDPERRIATDPQYGYSRRQPAAADAL